MFVSRNRLRQLEKRLEHQERRIKSQGDLLHKSCEKLGTLDKRVDSIAEFTGVIEAPSIFDYSIYNYFFRGRKPKREAKPFNLQEKISAIMDHLNLTEQVTAETKLITKPVEKKKKGKK